MRDRDGRFEVIIVGGGFAGLSAGLYCRRAELGALLLEKGLPGGQIAISKDAENFPGMEGSAGLDLADKLVRQVKSSGLRMANRERSSRSSRGGVATRSGLAMERCFGQRR